MKDLMTADEAAAFLGYSGTTVRVWCRKGLLPAFKLGRDWVIERAVVETFVPPKRGRPRTRKVEGEQEWSDE